MAISQLTIHRDGLESFRFEAYRSNEPMAIERERSDMIRFMDDAIDTLMRLKNIMTTKEINYMHHHSYQVKINAGDEYEPV